MHILLNVFGAIIFGLIPGLNRIPEKMAEYLARFIASRQVGAVWLVVYVGLMFFILPFALMTLLS
ncbi:MAG: hypothetical protein R2827_10975 [Bdellovibrionales bacterium]